MRYNTTLLSGLLLSTVTAGVLLSLAGQVHAAPMILTCNPVHVGYRTDLNRLKIGCSQGTDFWAFEATANPTCGFKATYDALKMFHSTATSALLSGKAITIYFVKQTVCNTTDNVPTEIYLKY